MIQGKRVLITGGGGSIGSELVRQVLSFQPSRLVVLDHSEYNLYAIDQELVNHELYSDVVVAALVDIKDREALRNIMKEYSPQIVIHAAAYKHVHLVETNPFTSVLNNIEGTKNLLDLSDEYKVENFVQISTDKAVNPAGIMGSTKRICEILVSLHGLKMKSKYSSVRFGNVLGSSGSLIPLLKKQIEDGRPLTITHKDMTRYFMLIEEAVALVLKAASIAEPGDINVLRMGEPVKIVDIAKSLITLMGKTESEVDIQFKGLRPGEKMFEELYISGKELNTEHPDILVLPKGDALPEGYDFESMEVQIKQMISDAKKSDMESIYLLRSIVNSNYKS
jgi:FlaA1/EpsC-like NDP-sugar epimerase